MSNEWKESWVCHSQHQTAERKKYAHQKKKIFNSKHLIHYPLFAVIRWITNRKQTNIRKLHPPKYYPCTNSFLSCFPIDLYTFIRIFTDNLILFPMHWGWVLFPNWLLHYMTILLFESLANEILYHHKQPFDYMHLADECEKNGIENMRRSYCVPMQPK